MVYDPNRPVPWRLSWRDVDLAGLHVDPDEALEVVRSRTPTKWPRPSFQRRAEWADAVTDALVARFGPWTCGWYWGRNNTGGPVGSWCCVQHSVTSPEQTTIRVRDALLEWHGWLVELGRTFDGFGLCSAPEDDAQLAAWERAVVQLVTLVVAQTGDGNDAWYQHCEQVLRWCLAHAAVPEDRHQEMVTSAIGGRFASWAAPDPEVVTDVGRRLAEGVFLGDPSAS
jgi:hypothetical protein